MTTFSTNIKTNDISSITGDLVVSSQSSFTLAPHCNGIPSTAQDLTNKTYVDTRLVNSGSGTNLYLNQSTDQIAPYKQLSTSITSPSSTVNITIAQPTGGASTLVQQFITDSGYPGTVTIPAGIYVLNQFGRAVGGTSGTLTYYFILSKRPLNGADVILGTSAQSADINTSVTDIFFCQLSLPAQPAGGQTLLATDKLIVDIYATGNLTNVLNSLESSYLGNTYSYLTTPLVSGSNFLSLNNVFTGTNSFTAQSTSSAPNIAALDSSQKIPPTSWVSTYFLTIATAASTYLTTALGVTLAGTQTITGDKTFTPNITLNGPMPVVTTTSSTIAPTITFVSSCIANRLVPYLPTALGVTLANTQTITGNKTFDDGLTLGVGKNITLSSGTVAPVAGQLGYIIPNIYPTTTTLINSTDTSILTQSLAAGTWLLSYQFRLAGNPGGLVSIFLVKITAGTLSLASQTNYITEGIPSYSSTARSGSVVVKLTTATNVSLTYYLQTSAVINITGFNTSPNDYTYLQAVRIG